MKNFKNLFFTAAICLITGASFVSCEDISESIPVDGSDFPGVYRLTSYKINELDAANPGTYIPATADLNGDMTLSSDLTNESSCYAQSYIKFNSNHTYSRFYTYDDGGTCTTGLREAGVWSRVGDVITITSSDTNGEEEGIGMTQYMMDFNYSSGSGTISGSRAEIDNFTGNSFGVGRVDFIYAKVAE